MRNHFLRLSERFCFVLLLFKNAHFYFEELDFCEKNHMLTEEMSSGMSLHRGNSEKSFP